MPYALITGASKGIGKAIAFELASRKNDVLLVARSADLLQQIAAEIQAKFAVKVAFFATDLAANDAAEKVKNFCETNNFDINILVNNAGYGLNGSFENLPIQEQLNMMQLNMNVLVQLCHAFLPMLKQQQKAYILNVSSTTAYQAIPFMGLYAASKAFVLSFSRALKIELKKTSVSVTCLVPGSTATDFSNRAGISEELVKKGENVTMSSEAVAKIAIDSMMAGNAEIIPGFVNKIGAFFPRFLPKSLPEKIAEGLYEVKS
jgi:uncharacterized protein